MLSTSKKKKKLFTKIMYPLFLRQGIGMRREIWPSFSHRYYHAVLISVLFKKDILYFNFENILVLSINLKNSDVLNWRNKLFKRFTLFFSWIFLRDVGNELTESTFFPLCLLFKSALTKRSKVSLQPHKFWFLNNYEGWRFKCWDIRSGPKCFNNDPKGAREMGLKHGTKEQVKIVEETQKKKKNTDYGYKINDFFVFVF